MKRVLLLGGNGFIGSHIKDALITKDVALRVFDRSLSSVSQSCNIEYLKGSLDQVDKLAEALMDVDVVIHMISSTVPSTSNLDPVNDIQANLVSTVRLLDMMQKQNVKRIIFLSSGGTVYGRPSALPVNELHSLNPICSYGAVKVAIENYLNIYWQLYGISPVIFRVSNPYGPRQGKLGVQGVIGTFMNKIIDNQSLDIWGDGSVKRDYIYIDDIVDVITSAVFHDDVEGVFNLGYGASTSLVELLEMIEIVTGKVANVVYKPSRSFDIDDIFLDISKVSKTFSWQPKIDLRRGLNIYYEWLCTNGAG